MNLKKIVNAIDRCFDFLEKFMFIGIILLLLIQLVYTLYFVLKPLEVSAKGSQMTAKEMMPTLSVFIPGLDKFTPGQNQNWIGEYVKAWYNYLAGALGIVAVVMIMWAGIKWITSGGNASRIEASKMKIKNCIMGIIFLLGSYVILKTINPALLNLSLPRLDTVDMLGKQICCENITTKERNLKRHECIKETERLVAIHYCQQKVSKVCANDTKTPCGTVNETNNCMGINTNDQAICVIKYENGVITKGTAFGDGIQVKLVGEGKHRSITQNLECGKKSSYKLNSQIGTYCSPSLKATSITGCWAAFEDRNNMVISLPACN